MRPQLWERQIRAYEAEDRRAPVSAGAVLFVGSSSIRYWRSLAEDMAPLRVLNRGFGGAHADHVLHYADRIVFPYQPRAVVFYAGDNDLARGTGKTPASVVADVRRFVDALFARQPATRLYLLSVKPSRLRRERWPVMREANERLEELAAGDERVRFLDVATGMLGPDGVARRELFRWDRLHMSGAGYRIWTDVVRPALVEDLGT